MDAYQRAQNTRHLADVIVQDGDEHDILAWPGDLRGRHVNWRMTPAYARRLAAALEMLIVQDPELWQAWYPEVEGLQEAARRFEGRPFRPPGTD